MDFLTAKIHLIQAGYDEKKITEFFRWAKKNPEIWAEFEEVTLEAWRDGVKNWGAKGVAEVVRWNLRKQSMGDFILNNNYVSFYARIFAMKHREAGQIFEFRDIGKNRKEAA